MRVIGVMSPDKGPTGLQQLVVRKLPIAVRDVPEEFIGKRVELQGFPVFDSTLGAFFQVESCTETKVTDKNDVVVHGKVLRIMPETTNGRGARTQSILVRQNTRRSVVLITALASNVDKLQASNLSIGQSVEIAGYISYHGRGLHVLYMRTLREEGTANAGLVQQPEHQGQD